MKLSVKQQDMLNLNFEPIPSEKRDLPFAVVNFSLRQIAFPCSTIVRVSSCRFIPIDLVLDATSS